MSPLLAHRVVSLRCNDSSAFEVKRTYQKFANARTVNRDEDQQPWMAVIQFHRAGSVSNCVIASAIASRRPCRILTRDRNNGTGGSGG
jgi:hypothetical protein